MATAWLQLFHILQSASLSIMSAGAPTQTGKKKHHIDEPCCLQPFGAINCVFFFFLFACSMSVSHFALCNFSRLHMLTIHNPSIGVSPMHRLSSVLILAGLSPCMPLLIALCWALCSVCYQVVGLRWGMSALLWLTSPKSRTKKKGKRSGELRGDHIYKSKAN